MDKNVIGMKDVAVILAENRAHNERVMADAVAEGSSRPVSARSI